MALPKLYYEMPHWAFPGEKAKWACNRFLPKDCRSLCNIHALISSLKGGVRKKKRKKDKQN
jgi:hypothetical protein